MILPREASPARRALAAAARARRAAMVGPRRRACSSSRSRCSRRGSRPTIRSRRAGRAIRKAPSAAHWFGTDEIGRDVLSRVICGARASLLAGVVSVCIALSFGVPIGLLAGYAGRWPDALISRMTDAMLAMPVPDPRHRAGGVPRPEPHQRDDRDRHLGDADLHPAHARRRCSSVKVEDYVEAARAVGNSPLRIALRHILPNVVPPLIVQATLAIAAAVIAEASLSFLGLGQQPPAPSWGSMLNTAKNYVEQRAVDGGLARRVDLPAGAVVQPAGRRPARRARSAARMTKIVRSCREIEK